MKTKSYWVFDKYGHLFGTVFATRKWLAELQAEKTFKLMPKTYYVVLQ